MTKVELIQAFLVQAELPLENDFIKLWTPSDYTLVISESESFYKGLSKSQQFIQADLANLDAQLANLTSRRAVRYLDSRSYLNVVHDVMSNIYGAYTVLDIGGYLGRFSIEFNLMIQATSIGNFLGDVFCFEPSPMKHLLDLNLLINNCSDVVAVNSAATDSDGFTQYHYNKDVFISGRVIDFRKAGSATTVQSCRIDTFLRQNDLEGRPTIAKIDVEGAEHLVLEGFGDELNYLECAIVEYWPDTFKTKFRGDRTLGSFLFENYYVLYLRNSLYPSFPMPLIETPKQLTPFLKARGNIDVLLIRKRSEAGQNLLDRLLAIELVP